MSWVDYATMVVGSIQLVPPQNTLPEWEADYEAMCDVFFFGDAPPFEEIMATTSAFQDEFNRGAVS